MADEAKPGLVEQAKEAIATTIADTKEIAVERLRDLVGDEALPTVDRVVSHAVQSVEQQAATATATFSKKDAARALIIPAIDALIESKTPGIAGSLARRTLQPIVDDAVGAMIDAAVDGRNQIFGKDWGQKFLGYVHKFEAWLERLLGIDLDKDGGIGTIGGVAP